MKKRLIYIALSVVIISNISSCKKYLDVLPDNRAELNTEEKISKLLVSAYPTSPYVLATELASDNVDDCFGTSNPNSTRQYEEMYNWVDATETGTDSVNDLWSSCYGSIASANQALDAIKQLGNPASLDAARGEALIARAYNHFILVNVFAQHYSAANSATDLGITYMLAAEKELNPKYERNTVKEVYEFIVKDIQDGLPLVSDAAYTNASVAKFHFNVSAANAFAARVYLYMADWPNAVKYATASFANNPASYVRDYAKISSFSAVLGNMAREYNGSSIKANFLISPSFSNMGVVFGAYYAGSRFNHGRLISDKETITAKGPFGSFVTSGPAGYRLRAYGYGGTNLDKYLLAHDSYQFEYTDPVAAIGYRHGVFTPFTFEEALLTRAEGYVHSKNYTDALADMQLWANFTYNTPPTITMGSIEAWATGTNYFTPDAPTPKKKLNPDFALETGTQENMIHAILYMRRIESLHTGLRWFDVKRYGIEITRRTSLAAANSKVSDNTLVISNNKLVIRDKRRAIQLPQDVVSAGLTPNPR